MEQIKEPFLVIGVKLDGDGEIDRKEEKLTTIAETEASGNGDLLTYVYTLPSSNKISRVIIAPMVNTFKDGQVATIFGRTSKDSQMHDEYFIGLVDSGVDAS